VIFLKENICGRSFAYFGGKNFEAYVQLVLATCLFVAHTFDLCTFVGMNDVFVVLSIFYLAIGSPNM
jgi:hypothetical protein